MFQFSKKLTDLAGNSDEHSRKLPMDQKEMKKRPEATQTLLRWLR